MPDYITNSGTNTQGNHWDTRVDDYGRTGFHYSNQNGSFHYTNTDGSKFYDSGDGYRQYTSPAGDTWRSYPESKSGSGTK